MTGTHLWPHGGVKPLLVTVTGAAGGTAVQGGNAYVADAPLAATGLSVTAKKKTTYSGNVALLNDGNPLATAADYTVSINWGDGSVASVGTVTATSVAGSFTIASSHAYATNGTYHVTTSVVDNSVRGDECGQHLHGYHDRSGRQIGREQRLAVAL